MKPGKRAKWAKSVVRGEFRFIIVEGIVKTGIPSAIFVTAATHVDKYGFTIASVPGVLLAIEILFLPLYALIFGGATGLILWYATTRALKRSTAEE